MHYICCVFFGLYCTIFVCFKSCLPRNLCSQNLFSMENIIIEVVRKLLASTCFGFSFSFYSPSSFICFKLNSNCSSRKVNVFMLCTTIFFSRSYCVCSMMFFFISASLFIAQMHSQFAHCDLNYAF